MHISFSLRNQQKSRRRGEHRQRTIPLYQTTLFPYTTPQRRPSARNRTGEATVSFRFRSIEFQKKRALPFFLARELLTQQKCIASLSRRNVRSWKIRKGRLVGCRVTLRRNSLASFLDTLERSLPRREKLTPLTFSSKSKTKGHSFSSGSSSNKPKEKKQEKVSRSWTTRKQSVVAAERRRRALETERERQGRPWTQQARSFTHTALRKADASDAFTLGELVLLYPFERGLGLHPDVQRFHLSLRFSTRLLEERSFLLRALKLPLLLLKFLLFWFQHL